MKNRKGILVMSYTIEAVKIVDFKCKSW